MGEVNPKREIMVSMTVLMSRIAQLLITVMVVVEIVFLVVVSYGPDIDGRTQPLQDIIPIVAIELTIILAFTLSAIALFRWHKLGWWSCVLLDLLLGSAAALMMDGDFRDRYMVTQAGRHAFNGDLTIHGAGLLLSAVAAGFLLLAHKHFLTSR